MTAMRQHASGAVSAATSLTVTLPSPVLAGSLVVAAVWSSAPGPGFGDFITGLSGTWNRVDQTEFHMGYLADAPAGGADVVIAYPFNVDYAAVVAELVGPPETTEQAFVTNVAGPDTLDVSGGAPPAVAGWLAVIGWEVRGSAATPTTPTIDTTNGTYALRASDTYISDAPRFDQVAVELYAGDVPADGPTNAVGTRTDSAFGTGAYLLLGPTPVPPPPVQIDAGLLAEARQAVKLVVKPYGVVP